MGGVELESRHALRRRQLLGIGLFAMFLLLSVAFSGWRITPIWTVFDDDEGTFAAGDPFEEWIYAVCDGETQQITVLRDGRLEGAAALDSLRTARFPDWCDLPVVDNPELAAWQARLDELQALTGTAESSAAEILAAAERMPVSVLYLKPVTEWIRADADQAVAFLDAVAQRSTRFDHPNPAIVRARRDDFARMIEAALDQAATREIAPEQLDSWAAAREIAGDGRAIRKLASLDGISDRAIARILERLEAVPMPERGDLYMQLAPRLVHDGRYAALLDKQLELVPHETRFVAARQLLARSDASPQLAIALLSNFRRKVHGPDVQLDLFMAIADELKHEAEAPLLLTMRLRDLADMQRRIAATYLLGLDEEGETAFALSLLRSFADLHPFSRPKFAHAVMQSAQFGDPAVQEALLLAIELHMRGPEQQELLAAIRRHRGLQSDLEPRISAERG